MCDSANKRIDDLIKRSGSPVMIVKGDGHDRAKIHMEQIDKNASMMQYKTRMPLRDCLIRIMYDEIIAQDSMITDMANTIDRMEAALSNVLNERDALLGIVKEDAPCLYCKHNTTGNQTCKECFSVDSGKWEWRGVQDLSE